METDAEGEKSITIVPTTIEDFIKEKIPLYTAVKKECKIIWGDVDLTITDFHGQEIPLKSGSRCA